MLQVSGVLYLKHRGEWTGSITISLEGVGLFVMVSDNKRNKAKYMISGFLSVFLFYRPNLLLIKGYGTEDWISGAFSHGLPYYYAIPKRSLSDDEIVEDREGPSWLEDLKEIIRRIRQFWCEGG